MPIEAGATYVFDLGYYDYALVGEAGRRGLPHRDAAQEQHAADADRRAADPARCCRSGGAILSDRIGLLPARQANSRSNPFSDAVREVRVRIDTGKVLRILTNDLHAPAEEIADLYKRRWAIELFFRWVKQTLRIKQFIGTSENAVRIQVAVALIAFLLLRLAHAGQRAVPNLLEFVRSVRVHLLSRRDINALNGPERPPKTIPGSCRWAEAWLDPDAMRRAMVMDRSPLQGARNSTGQSWDSPAISTRTELAKDAIPVSGIPLGWTGTHGHQQGRSGITQLMRWPVSLPVSRDAGGVRSLARPWIRSIICLCAAVDELASSTVVCASANRLSLAKARIRFRRVCFSSVERRVNNRWTNSPSPNNALSSTMNV